jgi:hypothetical protein
MSIDLSKVKQEMIRIHASQKQGVHTKRCHTNHSGSQPVYGRIWWFFPQTHNSCTTHVIHTKYKPQQWI